MATDTSFFKKRAPTLYVIIAFKLIKGVLCLLLALGVYKLAGSDLQDIFDRLLHFVHLDPENRFLSDISDMLDQITTANVRWVATGTLLYSLFALVEREAPTEKLVVTTTVTNSGVELLNGGQARVLIFVNQQDTRAGTKQTTYGGAMLAVTAIFQNGRWKIENIDTFS